MKLEDIKAGKLIYSDAIVEKENINSVSKELQEILKNSEFIYVGNTQYYEKFTYEMKFVPREKLKDRLNSSPISDKRELANFFSRLDTRERYNVLQNKINEFLKVDLPDYADDGLVLLDMFIDDELMPVLIADVEFNFHNNEKDLEVLAMNKHEDLYLVKNLNATYTPYVVVNGLNRNGEWLHGSYFKKLDEAYRDFAEKTIDYPTCVKYLMKEEILSKGYEMDSKKVDEIYEGMMQNDAIVSPLNETIVDMIEKANDEITQTESLDEYEEEYER